MFKWFEVIYSRVIYTDDGAQKEHATFKVLCHTACDAMCQTRGWLHESVWEFESIQEVTE